MNLAKALNEKYGQVSYTDRFSEGYDEAWGIEAMYGKNPNYPSLKIKLYTFFTEPNYRVLTITYIVNEERCEDEIRGKYGNKITTNEI